MSPSTGVVFRCLYGLPLLALAAWLEWRSDGPMSRRTIGLSAVAGVFFAADLLTFHYVVDDIGAGLATIMGNLQVVVVAIAAWLLWGERPRREVMVALPVMLFGVVLISGVIGGDPVRRERAARASPSGSSPHARTPATCWSSAGRHRPRGRRARSRSRPSSACSRPGCSARSSANLDLVPSLPAHAYLLAYGISSQSIGYLLIQVSLPRLPAVLTSAILLAQPVMTVVLAIILLGEAPSPGQIAGVGLVVVGLALATGTIARVRDNLQGGLASGGTPA